MIDPVIDPAVLDQVQSVKKYRENAPYFDLPESELPPPRGERRVTVRSLTEKDSQPFNDGAKESAELLDQDAVVDSSGSSDDIHILQGFIFLILVAALSGLCTISPPTRIAASIDERRAAGSASSGSST